jgi:multidrug efflux pump subunit AcrA (membrane-fusion protein)
MTATTPLSLITKAESDAVAAAARAQKAAEIAQAKADAARQKAEQERAARMIAYADKLGEEWSESHTAATTTAGAARAALETAVADGGDIFLAYRAVLRTRTHVFEIDSELAQIRGLLGRPARETPPPSNDFASDLGDIFNRLGMELQDDALQRIVQRRADFINGGKS